MPANTSYTMQDGKGDVIDLGWALNPEWGGYAPYAFLYSLNGSLAQQVVYTADGKLASAQDPGMYLYNDGGYLALGPNGDTFTIEQKSGGFTVKDGDLYLESPLEVSPPNKLAFTAKPVVWGFINTSPTHSLQ